MGFAELLKLAEKKQYEPVMIEVKPKVEVERPMTKRQKIEYLQERERKMQRERKDLETDKKISVTKTREESGETTSGASLNKPNKIPLNKTAKIGEKSPILNSILSKSPSKVTTTAPKKINDKSNEKHNVEKCSSSKIQPRNELLEERKKLEAERRRLEEMRRAIEEEKRKLALSKNKQESVKSHSSNKEVAKTKISSMDRQIPKDIKPRQFPPSDVKSINKPKEMIKKPLANVKKREFI